MEKLDIPAICNLAKMAGRAILDIYDRDYEIEIKEDNSPLTAADKASHRIIVDGLGVLTPDIPILSEEGRGVCYEERKNWQRFWLVDPLDGTKEFIKRNGEFTVNLALVENGTPVLGVIYAPALDRLYFGIEGVGAWNRKGAARPVRSKRGSLTQERD